MDKQQREILDEMKSVFEEFKDTNDKRLKEVKDSITDTADALVEEKLVKLNGRLDELDENLKEVELKAAKADLQNTFDDPTGTRDPEYVKAFGDWFTKGEFNPILEEKAINVGTPADGCYAVPEEIDRAIGQIERQMSPMRSVSNVIQVGTPDWKKLYNLGGAASGWVGETAARTETNTPTLAEVAPPVGEIYANPATTQRALDDVFFDVAAWLADEVGVEFGEQENLAFTSGTGTNQPEGVLNATFATTDDDVRAFGQIQRNQAAGGGAGGNFDLDDVIDLIYRVKPGYRRNASFMMEGQTIAYMRKFKDSNGQYLWQPSNQAGEPSTFLGYGIVENDDWPALASAANVMAFGDWRRGYYVVDRVGTRVLRDPYTNKPYVHFYTTKRVGGKYMDTLAIKVMQATT